MAVHKKRTIAFLIVVVLSGSIISIYSAKSSANSPAKSTFNNSGSLFTDDPNSSVESGGSLGARELFYKMMVAILLVVGLGAAAIYVSKKLVPRISKLPGKKVRVCETTHLGPHKAIHLIRAGEKLLLVGSTNQNINMLADVTDSLADTDLSSKRIDDKEK